MEAKIIQPLLEKDVNELKAEVKEAIQAKNTAEANQRAITLGYVTRRCVTFFLILSLEKLWKLHQFLLGNGLNLLML